jgi:hypothetical protein
MTLEPPASLKANMMRQYNRCGSGSYILIFLDACNFACHPRLPKPCTCQRVLIVYHRGCKTMYVPQNHVICCRAGLLSST